MQKNKFCLFGLPITFPTKESFIDELEKLYKEFQKDHRPRYITSINAYFLTHLHGWLLNRPLHLELLQILRNADLITIDSHCLENVCKLTGIPSPSPFPSEELLETTADFLNRKKLSIYLLGGKEAVTQEALNKLKINFPNMKIAGSATPLIVTKGERLEESQERDQLIIEAINKSGADMLILQLGHPKQEIWFQRVHSRLTVPLIIGVGGAFERYIQKSTVEPAKTESFLEAFKSLAGLFSHLIDGLKYAAWLIPLIIFRGINHFMAKTFAKEGSKLQQRRYFFLSPNRSITVIPFPAIFSIHRFDEISAMVEEAVEEDHLVLDFQFLHHLNAEGIGFIMEVKQWCEVLSKRLFLIGVNSDIRTLLKLNGVFDYFENLVCRDANDVLYRIAGKYSSSYLEIYESIYQEHNEVVVSFFGTLNLSGDDDALLNKLKPILDQKNCILNLTYCTEINNLGIGFLIKIHDFQTKNNRGLALVGVSRSLKRQFRQAKVDSLFEYQK